MHKVWLALAFTLTGTGCPYVRSAVKQALDDEPQQVGLRERAVKREAMPFPAGTVRTLDDEVFSRETTELGFFDPRKFLDRAPLMFYALEEQQERKIPVLFVHGIRGGAGDFASIVEKLDRTRYQPWFFHYPSGAELSQLSDTFYSLFLSGKVVRTGEAPLVIVAHSMGGLIVRDALNRCTGAAGENKVARLVTIASPMGGLATAGGAADGVLVIRSWRDLDPDSPFIAALHRRPLPSGLAYFLVFAYANNQKVKVGENSDGVVSIASQLDRAAQAEATAQFGFNETHTGVLRDSEAIGRVLAVVGEVRPPVSGGE